MHFSINLFTWLPYSRIDNLLWGLPDREKRGPLAQGPYFQGDNFTVPPPSPEDMRVRTARAWHGLELPIRKWGQDIPIAKPAVQTGMFHLLAEDGLTRLQSAQGIVLRSSSRVGFLSRANAYEVELSAEVTVPFLVEAAVTALEAQGQEVRLEVPPAAHPVASWHLQLYLQEGDAAPLRPAPLNYDESPRFFGRTGALGGEGANRIHGNLTMRMFPSYVVYVSLRRGEAGSFATPAFFFSGFGRNIGGILSQETTRVRTITW